MKVLLFLFRIAVSLGLIITVILPGREVFAAAITVNSLLNTTNNADGVCTIREAIINANNDAATWTNCVAGAGADVISFSAAGTITLTSALPNITDVDGLTINGGNNITISGNNLFRIVTVNANVPVTFQDIILTAGSVNGSGGAISNSGNLTVTNVSFLNNLTITNAANDGGAINQAAGTLTITNSTFTGNYTLDNGGAIYIAGGTVNITGSTFSNNNNIAIDDGGAIYLNVGTLMISGSTFSGNRANEEGGAIFKNGGTLTIDGNSMVDGNISVNDGGGLYAVNAGMTTITNSTFQNHVDAGINNGGAIYFATGTLNITGSIFSGNRAPLNLGGAIYFASGTGTISGTSFTGNNSQTNGGAIYKNGGNLTINNNSVFDGNYSQTNGGAVYAINAGALTIANSTFQNQNNAVIDSGGALFFNTGTLNITGSTFSANRAQDAGDQGGAIYFASGTGAISGTSFTNNIADTYGGAVRVNGGTLTVNAASTFTGNTATINDGGALYMATGTVNVSATTFLNNVAGTDGGAITAASGTLTLANDAFNTNRADDGGAIYHNAATLLTIANSTFNGNLANGEADGDGGAITMNSAAAGSSLTITGNTFTNNIANDDGGALWNNAEPVTITSSTFSGNQARSGNGTAEGGAIYNSANADATSTRLSAFTNNSVAATANVNALGGAISNAGTAFVLANDTFSGNAITKSTAGAGNALGGAVYTGIVAADTTTIHNVTFNGNSAAESGTGTPNGGSLHRVAGTVTVANSILANGTENGIAGNCGGTITNGGNNIHFNGADCPAAFTNINPNLGVLTGAPAYYPLNAASPAINAGNNAICATAATTNNQSQNGVTRPVGAACDIGSYEIPDPPPTVLSITRLDPNPTNAASVQFLVTFSENVIGENTTNFSVTVTGGVGGASFTSVSAGPGSTRTVTVNTGTGDGTLRLDMANSTGVVDGGGNAVTNVPFTAGEVYTLDKTAPTVTINQALGQADPTNTSPINFTVVFSEPVINFATGDVTLSGTAGAITGTVTGGPTTYTVAVSGMTSDGTVISALLAGVTQDAVGNLNTASTSADNTVTYDTTPPQTVIDSNPANPSNNANPTFTFSGNDGAGSGIASFECQIDGGGFSACTSGSSFGPLTDGTHTFDVRAIDNAGNVDASPASFSWTLDTVSPDSSFTATPSNPDGNSAPAFSFTGNDGTGSGVASFECQMDGGGFSACTSGSSFDPLADGSHTFEVRAVDNVGNTDPTPASYTWLVDTTPPDTTITVNPPNPDNDNTPAFSFTGNDGTGSGVASFECQMDGGGFTACASGSSFGPLIDGSHTFEVRAIDNLNQADTTPAAYNWTVDTTEPDTSITANPTNPSNNNTPVFSFTGSDGAGSGIASFECQVNGGGFSACTSGSSFGPFTDGSHTFEVRAIDNIGNIDSSPASYTWTVDIAEPDTTITVTPPNPDNNSTPSFAFTGNDGAGSGVASFECQIDGIGGFTTCTSGASFGPLTDGLHTLEVRAVDGAGNSDSTPASYTWTVDAISPDTTITSNPLNPSNIPNPTFDFTGDDGAGTGVASFECQIDGGGFMACTSGSSFGPLGNGSHTFEVRAIDMTSNADPTPATYTWVIDLAYPIVLFTSNTTPANGSTLTSGPTQITIEYSKDIKNDGSVGAANSTANYLLVEEGVNNTFDTVSCVAGLVADDMQITINSATYANNGGSGPFVATLAINSGAALPVSTYRLFVCGTTSIEDLASNELNNGASDALVNFIVVPPQQGGGGSGGGSDPQASSLIPATGFPQNKITTLPFQPADKMYAATDLWLEIPKLGVKVSIVGVPQTKDGWDVTWLNKDAGWLNGSAYPTWNGNSVITAHVWDAINKPGPFAQLKSLKYGDQVKIHAFGMVYTYEITESALITNTDAKTAFKHNAKSVITLITCEDYKEFSNTYSYRRMVRAVLVSVVWEK